MPAGADPGGNGAMLPSLKMLKSYIAFWSAALWLIHWLWNSSNKHLCLKCTKIRIRLAARTRWGSLSAPQTALAAIEGVLLLRGGTFQLTGFRTAKPHWNTRPNGNAESPIVPTFF